MDFINNTAIKLIARNNEPKLETMEFTALDMKN